MYVLDLNGGNHVLEELLALGERTEPLQDGAEPLERHDVLVFCVQRERERENEMQAGVHEFGKSPHHLRGEGRSMWHQFNGWVRTWHEDHAQGLPIYILLHVDPYLAPLRENAGELFPLHSVEQLTLTTQRNETEVSSTTAA